MTALDIIRLDRHLGLGSTDAKRVLEGDWLTLYREKTGEAEPEDLSGVFRVQLGIHTESFHLEWLAKTHGFPLSVINDRLFHPDFEFMFCHLDGWRADHDTFVEVKHSNGQATARDRAIYYMPQLQHQLAITGKDYAFFSVIAGNNDPEMVIVDRNPEYIVKLIELEASFWWHVTNKVPPEITPTGTQAELQRIGANTPIDGLKPYDMTGSNEWASAAVQFTTNREAAQAFEEAKATLKTLVPADAVSATGHGVTIKRAKNGALRFS